MVTANGRKEVVMSQSYSDIRRMAMRYFGRTPKVSFGNAQPKVERKLGCLPKLEGCTSIAMPRYDWVYPRMSVIVRTGEHLTRQMLAVQEQQYPVALYDVACKVYSSLQKYVEAEQLRIVNCDLLFMAAVQATPGCALQDIGVEFDYDK